MDGFTFLVPDTHLMNWIHCLMETMLLTILGLFSSGQAGELFSIHQLVGVHKKNLGQLY